MSETRYHLGLALGSCMETVTVPYHALRLVAAHPSLRLRFCVTPKALNFVTRVALEGISRSPVYCEENPFDPLTHRPFHLEFGELDLLIVYPATARLIAEMALGIISCPVTRAFAFTPKAKVFITPYLHPAMEPSIYIPHLAMLQRCGCHLVMPSQGATWRDESAWDATRRALCRQLVLDPDRQPPALVRAAGS